MSDHLLVPPFSQESLQKLNLKSGDIVLFSCDWIIGKTIKAATNCTYTHAAIVVVENGIIKCLESAVNQFGNGVHLIELERVLADSLEHQQPTLFAIRPLKNALSEKQRNELQEFIAKFINVKYELNIFQLLKASMVGPDRISEDAMVNNILGKPDINDYYNSVTVKFNEFLSSIISKLYKATYCDEALQTVFCSELVVAALKQLNILPVDISSSNFTPEDLSTNSRFAALKDNSICAPEVIFYRADAVAAAKKKSVGCKCALQ